MPRYPHRSQVAPRTIGNEHHISPAPTIAAIGPTPRNMRLPPEGDDPVTAAATFHVNLCAVLEHRSEDRSQNENGPAFASPLKSACGQRYSAAASSATEMTRPLRAFLNSTTPGRVAKIV